MHSFFNTAGPRRAPGHGVRGLGRSLVFGMALASSPWSALAASAAAGAEAPVRGLIVELRDAPSHAELARDRERALGVTQREPALGVTQREPALGVAQHDSATRVAQHESATRVAQHESATRVAREQARWQGVLAHAQATSPMLGIAERRAVGASAQLWRFERPLSAAQARALVAQLTQRAEVLSAVANTRERRLQAVNPPIDPFFGGQWWLQPAGGSDAVPIGQRSRGVPGFQSAWTSVTSGSANSVIAVLDNGIVGHPDLAGKVIAGTDMVGDVDYSNDGDGRDSDPTDPGDWVDSSDKQRNPASYGNCAIEDSSWHGTAIAGMLVANANNNEGGASMNWPGKVLAVRVAAKCGADVADIVDGMRWAAGLSVCVRTDTSGNCLETSPELAAPRARVVNISFGSDDACTPYTGAIAALRARNVLVVAAAGNEHVSTPTRPAKCPGVVGVAALNRDGLKSTYSNFGPSVAIATVGGDDPEGEWRNLSDSGLQSVGNDGLTAAAAPGGMYLYYGTSFSTPIVAGAASLMLAVNPALTVAQLEQGLALSARPHLTSTLGGNVAACGDANPGRCLCTTATCGAGILDVPQALAYAANPGGYVRPSRQAEVNDSAELQAAAALGPDRPANPVSPPDPGGGGGGGDGDGDGDGGGGGGGAMSALWLLALAAATVALARRRMR